MSRVCNIGLLDYYHLKSKPSLDYYLVSLYKYSHFNPICQIVIILIIESLVFSNEKIVP